MISNYQGWKSSSLFDEICERYYSDCKTIGIPHKVKYSTFKEIICESVNRILKENIEIL